MGGKEERRKNREGVNMKACFKGQKHFVPNDNHFPFVFSKCQTGHKAEQPPIHPNENQEHSPGRK